MHVFWQDQTARDLALRIMIAVEQEYADAGFRQLAHLSDEEQACLIVAPVAIVQVAGNDDECDFLFDSAGYEIVECCAGCRSNTVGSRAVLTASPLSGLSRWMSPV